LAAAHVKRDRREGGLLELEVEISRRKQQREDAARVEPEREVDRFRKKREVLDRKRALELFLSAPEGRRDSKDVILEGLAIKFVRLWGGVQESNRGKTHVRKTRTRGLGESTVPDLGL